MYADSYSALKYKGRRLSDYAYAGQMVPESKLAARPVTVHRVVCTAFDPPHFTLGEPCCHCQYCRTSLFSQCRIVALQFCFQLDVGMLVMTI